jgi:hypothetical protein
VGVEIIGALADGTAADPTESGWSLCSGAGLSVTATCAPGRSDGAGTAAGTAACLLRSGGIGAPERRDCMVSCPSRRALEEAHLLIESGANCCARRGIGQARGTGACRRQTCLERRRPCTPAPAHTLPQPQSRTSSRRVQSNLAVSRKIFWLAAHSASLSLRGSQRFDRIAWHETDH